MHYHFYANILFFSPLRTDVIVTIIAVIKCMKTIPAVMNPTFVVVEIRPEKNTGLYGI